MATATVGVLDVASVGPLIPVCKAFTALIEAATGAIEVAGSLDKLISWCVFLVDVFVEHGKKAGDLERINNPLNEFVSTTTELTKHATAMAARSKFKALICHRKDAKTVDDFENKLRRVWIDIQGVNVLDTQTVVSRLGRQLRPPSPAPMATIPAAALALPSRHVERLGLVSEIVSHLTASSAKAPYVLIGMGGAGKSVLASSVVRTDRILEHFRHGVFWVRVGRGGKNQLQALLEGLAREMSLASLAPHRFNSADDVIQHLTRVVAEDILPRLVVLDDVWEREVVDALQSTGLQLLVTTRRSSVVAVEGGRTFVGNMDKEEARELLKLKCGAVVLPEEADQVWYRVSPVEYSTGYCFCSEVSFRLLHHSWLFVIDIALCRLSVIFVFNLLLCRILRLCTPNPSASMDQHRQKKTSVFGKMTIRDACALASHIHGESSCRTFILAKRPKVGEACGWHALTLAIAGSLPSVIATPNSVLAWRKLYQEISQKKGTPRGPQMDADEGDDPTKLSLFGVLDLSLEFLGSEMQYLFLSLVVLARGVWAPTSMLASIWHKVRH